MQRTNDRLEDHQSLARGIDVAHSAGARMQLPREIAGIDLRALQRRKAHYGLVAGEGMPQAVRSVPSHAVRLNAEQDKAMLHSSGPWRCGRGSRNDSAEILMKRLFIALVILCFSIPMLGFADSTGMRPDNVQIAQADQQIDVNRASADELMKLKGIAEARANAIIKGRPYKRKDELVQRKIIPSPSTTRSKIRSSRSSSEAESPSAQM